MPADGGPAMNKIAAAMAALVGIAAVQDGVDAHAQAAGSPPLQLEVKIPLGEERGRIDHMAFDGKRQRLFVAELGNDSLAGVDLPDRKVIRPLTGLKEPQVVGYDPDSDMLYVANAKDGSVRLFQGGGYAS